MGYDIPKDHSVAVIDESSKKEQRAYTHVPLLDSEAAVIRPTWMNRSTIVATIRDAAEIAERNSDSVVQMTVTLAKVLADFIEAIPNQNLDFYRDLCHGLSVEAGWWSDLEEVLAAAPPAHHPRIINWYLATKLALVHSEGSETLEGLRKGLPDDHLPQYLSEHVELADLLIRVFDYCGRREIPIDEIVFAKLKYNADRADHKKEHREAKGGKSF